MARSLNYSFVAIDFNNQKERGERMEKTYNVNGIPNEMKELPGWMWWVGNKIPRTLRKDPATGKCNHNNPACLASLNEVLERIAQFKCKHGLAFSFLRDFGYCYLT